MQSVHFCAAEHKVQPILQRYGLLPQLLLMLLLLTCMLKYDQHVQAQSADPAAAGPVDCRHAGKHVEVVDGACRKAEK
jgi:hypothetical protein